MGAGAGVWMEGETYAVPREVQARHTGGAREDRGRASRDARVAHRDRVELRKAPNSVGEQLRRDDASRRAARDTRGERRSGRALGDVEAPHELVRDGEERGGDLM